MYYLDYTVFRNFDVVTDETKQLINTKKKIYIWGAGITGSKVYDYLKLPIEGFIDSICSIASYQKIYYL